MMRLYATTMPNVGTKDGSVLERPAGRKGKVAKIGDRDMTKSMIENMAIRILTCLPQH